MYIFQYTYNIIPVEALSSSHYKFVIYILYIIIWYCGILSLNNIMIWFRRAMDLQLGGCVAGKMTYWLSCELQIWNIQTFHITIRTKFVLERYTTNPMILMSRKNFELLLLLLTSATCAAGIDDNFFLWVHAAATI